MPQSKYKPSSYLIVVVIVSIIPIVTFFVLAYVQAVESARASLDRTAAIAVHRADKLIEDAKKSSPGLLATPISRESRNSPGHPVDG